MNNKELYKCAFSKLQPSGDLIMEEKEMEKVKPKFRCSAALAACLALLVMIGISSGATYAATGGQTANPIKLVKVFLDGEELGAYDYTKNEDGSYTIHLPETDDSNAEITVKNTDIPLDVNVKTKSESKKDPETYEYEIEINAESQPNSGSSSDAESDPAKSNEVDVSYSEELK